MQPSAPAGGWAGVGCRWTAWNGQVNPRFPCARGWPLRRHIRSCLNLVLSTR